MTYLEALDYITGKHGIARRANWHSESYLVSIDAITLVGATNPMHRFNWPILKLKPKIMLATNFDKQHFAGEYRPVDNDLVANDWLLIPYPETEE